MTNWPHQDRVHDECRSNYGKVRSWCVAAPCGSGKSRMMMRIAGPAIRAGKRVAIYSPRIQNTQQLINLSRQDGLDFGVKASSFSSLANADAPLQICSLQTVYTRMGDYKHEFPQADILIVDEAHQQTGEMAQAVFGRHRESCMAHIGYTATPVDLDGMYESLVSGVTYKELLECKAHLPAECFGPDRPDLSKLRTSQWGEFSSVRDAEVNPVPKIIGRVFSHWQKYNPLQLPAIGFAPGVSHSKHYTMEFMERGVPCAHIDGERTILVKRGDDGKLYHCEYDTTIDTRQAVIDGSRNGDFKVVWNRFVLREAVDMPWLFHAIVATSMGGLSTYLQAVGRVLRYWPDYDHVVVQDHGGNIDRHGLPNEEREWRIGDTNNSIQKAIKATRQSSKGAEAEPICCPKCNNYRTHGAKCPYCGHIHKRSVRMVRELDGSLVRKVGRITKYRQEKTFDDYYRSALYAGYFSGLTVKQAYKIARTRASRSGTTVVSRGSIYVPPDGSESWNRSVREVYPKFKPKAMGMVRT